MKLATTFLRGEFRLVFFDFETGGKRMCDYLSCKNPLYYCKSEGGIVLRRPNCGQQFRAEITELIFLENLYWYDPQPQYHNCSDHLQFRGFSNEGKLIVRCSFCGRGYVNGQMNLVHLRGEPIH